MNSGEGDNLVYVDRINKLAEYCATNGEYQAAIEYYVKLITIDSENGPAWTALGHCYLLVEDLQKSFNAYQRALYSLEDIKDPQLWYGIGILYEKFESYVHAISALIAVLKMSPNFYQKSEVLYKLGMIFAKTNQIQQAISYFQNSILTNTFTLKRKTDTLIKSVATGNEPRTMVMSDDGFSLYVVNYMSDTMVKIRTSDMQVIQTVKTGHHPVGITYDAQMRRVWVANYSGSLSVFEDK